MMNQVNSIVLAGIDPWFIIIAVLAAGGWLWDQVKKVPPRQGTRKSGTMVNTLKPKKAPRRRDPLQNENAQAFFDKLREKETAEQEPQQKLVLRKKPTLAELGVSEGFSANTHFEKRVDTVRSAKATNSTSVKKPRNVINRKDKVSIRKAIIINEVLGKPQAYKM